MSDSYRKPNKTKNNNHSLEKIKSKKEKRFVKNKLRSGRWDDNEY